MKECKLCSKEFEPSKGLVNFCSVSCANTRSHSKITKDKISNSLRNSEKFLKSEREKMIKKEQKKDELRKKLEKRILEADLNTLGYDYLRIRIILEQNKCCNKCKLNKWLGQPIILELEHKDGNNKNNNRENLEGLCPNCHSQTEFWRGRNKNKFGIKIREENLLELLKASKTISEALKKAGLSAKGNNYKRAKKIIVKYKLYGFE